MPRIPIFKLGGTERVESPKLSKYSPRLALEGLTPGIDNLRHDVYLSPKFVEHMRLQIARLVARHGNVESVLGADLPVAAKPKAYAGDAAKLKAFPTKSEPAEIKGLLADLHVAALNRAKRNGNFSVDLLGRLAIIKFLRQELLAQFAQLLERCRMKLKAYEGVRQQTALEFREKVGAFQVAKKTVLRKVGQELFHSLQE